jgi:hypothetical protein
VRSLLHAALTKRTPDLGLVAPGRSVDVGGEADVLAPLPVSGYLVKMVRDALELSFRPRDTRITGSVHTGEGVVELVLAIPRTRLGENRGLVIRSRTIDEAVDRAAAELEVAVAASTRHNRDDLRWAPSPDALQRLTQASELAATRRFDEAIALCRDALEFDGGALPLQYLLGSMHERHGSFADALAAYQAGMAFGLHDGLMWSASTAADDHRRASPVSSPSLHKIAWRHAIVLTFADHWVSHWLRGLLMDRTDLNPLIPGAVVHQASERASRPLLERRRSYEADRAEQSKRMRGFFEMRYLRDDHPVGRDYALLRLLVFSGSHEQRAPVPGRLRLPPVSTEDGDAYGLLWTEDPLDDLRRFWSTLARVSIGPEPDETPATPPALQAFADRYLRGKATSYSAMLEAASGSPSSGTAVTRLEVALETFDAVAQLRDLPAQLGPTALRDHLTLEFDADRLQRLSVALDLRAFFVRAARWELEQLKRGTEIRRPRRGDDYLYDLAILGCDARLLRTHDLRDATPSVGVRMRWGPRDASASPVERIREEAERAVQLVSDGAAADREQASYFGACVRALLINLPIPAGTDGERRNALYAWYREVDRDAREAVRRLNDVLGLRQRSAVDSDGRVDWILFEDPDLEALRPHPHFRKWAAAQTTAPTLDLQLNPRVARLRRRRTVGWRLFGGAKSVQAVHTLRVTARAAAARWHAIANDPSPSSYDFARALERDVRALTIALSWRELRADSRSRLELLGLFEIESAPSFPYPIEAMSTIGFSEGEYEPEARDDDRPLTTLLLRMLDTALVLREGEGERHGGGAHRRQDAVRRREEWDLIAAECDRLVSHCDAREVALAQHRLASSSSETLD